MDNKNSYKTMIAFDIGDKRRAYAIPYIVDVRQDGKVVKLTLSAPFNIEMPGISFDTEIQATNFFYDCTAKIEAYYKSMMPQTNDNMQDNADEIRIAREYEKKANETVSRLANFITTLCNQTMGDYEIAPEHLDDKMKRLDNWVREKRKGI